MKNFRNGDFIRLKNLEQYKIDRFSGRQINIFEINNIEDKYLDVNNCHEKILITEIESIPINGIDDFEIYYDPILAASIVLPNDDAPIHRKDKSYYYEKFERCFDTDNKSFQELIKEQGLQYVHEVQHFLFDQFSGDKGLKIDTF